jgi:hypothetical protein
VGQHKKYRSLGCITIRFESDLVQLEGAGKEKINAITHIIVCITVIVSSSSKFRNNMVPFIRICRIIRWFLYFKGAVDAVRREML